MRGHELYLNSSVAHHFLGWLVGKDMSILIPSTCKCGLSRCSILVAVGITNALASQYSATQSGVKSFARLGPSITTDGSPDRERETRFVSETHKKSSFLVQPLLYLGHKSAQMDGSFTRTS